MEPEEIPWIVGVLQARMRAYVMRRYGLKKISRLFVRAPLPENVREIQMDDHEVAVVTFTDEMRTGAREDAEWIQGSDREAGLRETFARRDIDWELAGVMGEYAAAQYLYADWRRARDRLREAGPSVGDFQDSQGRTFEVKTTRYHAPDAYMKVPVPKFMKYGKEIDFYVGTQMTRSGRDVLVHGYAAREEVGSAPVKDFSLGPAHCILLRELHPMSDLVPGVRDPETGKAMPWEPSILKYAVCVSPAKKTRTQRRRTRTRKRKLVDEQQLRLDETRQPRRR